MKVKKNIFPAELSYYGLYLLDYLRKYHPDKVSDTPFIAGREEAASETFEKERTAGSTDFSPYALLLEVVENEFSEEVQEQEREAFCREIFPHLKNLFAGYPTTDDTFALSPEHDLLYTELTGAIMLYLEAYGV